MPVAKEAEVPFSRWLETMAEAVVRMKGGVAGTHRSWLAENYTVLFTSLKVNLVNKLSSGLEIVKAFGINNFL
jgi:hypothetical protein